ncbi:hypothetical protein ACFFRR_003796 [Megaselia abdita]
MFRKKSRVQSNPPPAPPTAEEIIEDLETFHIPKKLPVRTRQIEDKSNLEEWWNMFETFLQDLSDMKTTKTTLNGYKISLESSQLEIETLGKNIENDIEENLEKTKSVLS